MNSFSDVFQDKLFTRFGWKSNEQESGICKYGKHLICMKTFGSRQQHYFSFDDP